MSRQVVPPLALACVLFDCALWLTGAGPAWGVVNAAHGLRHLLLAG